MHSQARQRADRRVRQALCGGPVSRPRIGLEALQSLAARSAASIAPARRSTPAIPAASTPALPVARAARTRTPRCWSDCSAGSRSGSSAPVRPWRTWSCRLGSVRSIASLTSRANVEALRPVARRLDRHDDMQAAPAGRLHPGLEPQRLQHVAHELGGRDDLLPRRPPGRGRGPRRSGSAARRHRSVEFQV